MVPESDEKDVTGEMPEITGEEKISGGETAQDHKESMEENLERLAALNLNHDQLLQPRFSTSMIRLVSALAGIVTLVLIYFILKLLV